jgi:outer membrane protein assembly factor BamE (lipoprotein component of BamABCDE complex)
MVEDLVRSRHLKSLKRKDIHTLLGEPMPYEGTPENEDWYVIEERYRNEADQFELPYLQRHLVIQFKSDKRTVSSLFIQTASDVPGKKQPRVVRVPVK